MRISNLVICMGDSTTSGSSAASVSYPRRLQRKLGPNWDVVNLGVGGIATAAMYSTTWLTQVKNVFTNAAMKYLVAVGGVNDLAGAADNSGACISAAGSAFTNLKTIFDEMSGDSTWAGGILCTPTPAVGYSSWSANRQIGYVSDSNSLRNKILAYAQTRVTILDIYNVLLDSATAGQMAYQGLSGSVTVNGTVIPKADFATGYSGERGFLHPGDAGHEAIATALASLIPH